MAKTRRPVPTAQRPAPKAQAQPQPYFKTLADNRRARFDYEVLESVEAGLVLTGTEIKSMRQGRVNLRDAYATPQGRELWLHGMHVAPWASAGPWNHEPTRPRKLLVRRDEAARLSAAVAAKGFTLVPLRLYVKGHYAKVQLAVARGRRQYDKRKRIIERETEREVARAIRQGR